MLWRGSSVCACVHACVRVCVVHARSLQVLHAVVPLISRQTTHLHCAIFWLAAPLLCSNNDMNSWATSKNVIVPFHILFNMLS